MKASLYFLVCLSSMLVFAGEVDRASISINSSRGPREMALQTEVYRTEYRQVQVPYTERVCTMETRYRQQCRTVPGQRVCRTEYRQVCQDRRICHPGPGGRPICQVQRVCQNMPVQVCDQRPPQTVCEQVPYQERVCRDVVRYRYETRPYTVLDKKVNAQVNFTLDLHPGVPSGFEFNLNGELNRDLFSLNANDQSSPALIFLAQESRQTNYSGDTLYLNVSESIEAIPLELYRAPIIIPTSFIYQHNGILRVTMPVGVYVQDLELGIRLTSPGYFLERNLRMNEFSVTTRDNLWVVEISLANLMGSNYPIGHGRPFELTLKTGLNPVRAILNRDQISDLSNLSTVRFILD